MGYSIQQCSPIAAERIREWHSDLPVTEDESKYPINAMLIGQSFCVPEKDMSSNSLRATISRKLKGTGKSFSVIWHDEFKCHEVVRVK